jgi:signal transduction histidine kinase
MKADVSRLFLRVFLWFWLGSFTLLLVLAVSVTIAQPEALTRWRSIGQAAMPYLGAHIANVYEKDGATAATAVISDIGREGRFRAWLYTADSRMVAGVAPAAGAEGAIHRALTTSDNAARRFDRDASLLATRIESGSRTPYVVLWESPRPLRWYAQASLPVFASRVAALLLASGIVCWLLTWQITKPIGTLRAAARRFADGDLAVRVGLRRELRRGDDLTDLAREFDRMAARIQELITAQQQLLADISHEVRSPLARLSLALDLARRRLGDEVPEHQRMAQEIERIDSLIGQLLTLARLRADAHQPQFEPLNLRELVREVAQDSRFEADGAGRTVTLDREIDARMRGDRGMLRSAIENVVRNAIRYTPEGTAVSIKMEPVVVRNAIRYTPEGTAVSIKMEPVVDVRGQRTAIVIRDRGPGVPPDMLARLFDPFFRADDARTPTSGGAGLGLAITRQAMLAHGGSATVENAPDGGLLVRLELPTERQ